MVKCPDVDFTSDKVGWTYCPSLPAAIIFAVLNFVLLLVHVFQAFSFRKKFSWVIILCIVWEVAGFALRAVSTQMMDQLAFYVPHQNLIVLAPLLFNAYIYMVLARMVHFYLPEQACCGVSARKLSVIFVLLDIIAMLVQASSAGLMGTDSPSTAKIGTKVYMGGIGLQELFVLTFTYLAIQFHRRMNELERRGAPSPRWRPLLYTEYAGLGLITIRIIYRMVEYSAGYDSDIAKAEAAFYVLDALTMVIGLALFCVYHPGRFLVGPNSEFPRKGKKNEKNNKESDGSEADGSGNDGIPLV